MLHYRRKLQVSNGPAKLYGITHNLSPQNDLFFPPLLVIRNKPMKITTLYMYIHERMNLQKFVQLLLVFYNSNRYFAILSDKFASFRIVSCIHSTCQTTEEYIKKQHPSHIYTQQSLHTECFCPCALLKTKVLRAGRWC